MRSRLTQLLKILSSSQCLLQGDLRFLQAFKVIFCACDLRETCYFTVLFQKQLIKKKKKEGQEKGLNVTTSKVMHMLVSLA